MSLGVSSVPLPARRRQGLLNSDTVVAYLLLLPWLIGFVFLIAGPMIASLYLSLTTYNIVQMPKFIGLNNYNTAFFRDTLFWTSLARTFTYAIVVAPCSVAGALGVAVMLNQ